MQVRSHKINNHYKIKGQAMVELVLIMALLLGAAVLVRSQFIEKENIFTAFITTPWKRIGGMMESGVWEERDQALASHPGHFQRMWSTENKKP